MALCSVKERSELGQSLVLAPERYDPRREALSNETVGPALGTVVRVNRKTISPKSKEILKDKFVVLDTSDANEGVLVGKKLPVSQSEIGSTKKIVPPGSIIISRLRPYLRQVGYVDEGIEGLGDKVAILCSTEFFVLTPRDERSLAFLVPLLLSKQVQEVLAASQEGGHHPRFNEDTLLGLPVSRHWLDQRDGVSKQVEKSIAGSRVAKKRIEALIIEAEETMNTRQPS